MGMSTQGNQYEAHFFIGMSLLGDGDRAKARAHFREITSTRAVFAGQQIWSRAFLTRLEKDPAWPPWIPLHPAMGQGGTPKADRK